MGNVWDIKARYKAAMENQFDTAGVRGIFSGGETPTRVNTVDYVTISTTGDAADFGDLTSARAYPGGAANRTRGCTIAGYTGSHVNTIDYVTFPSTGNAADFGDSTVADEGAEGCGNQHRAVCFRGGPSATDTIDFFNFASTGNAADFGDAASNYTGFRGAVANTTRGVVAGGIVGSNSVNVIEYVTISTTGDAADFGDLVDDARQLASGSSNTRGVFAGGNEYPGSPGYLTIIQAITTATLGNATDFGDLTTATGETAGDSSHVRGVVGGGKNPGVTDVIEYYGLSAGGTAADFGDLSVGRTYLTAFSDGHGGLESGLLQRPELGGHPDRAAFGGGFSPGQVDIIDSIQIMSTGNGADFGNLTTARGQTTGFASNTRGITYGGDTDSGSNTESNIIDYITLASVGNATDFGDTSVARRFLGAGSNDTRGFGGGGYTPSRSDVIDYITIASTGDAADFGDMLAATSLPSNFLASSTRGVTAGGQAPGTQNVMQYITIASTGNATDFGDLTAAGYSPGGASSKTRGLFAGGGDAVKKTIDYITIASTGNGADFGDLTGNRLYMGSTSNTTRAVFGVGQTPSLTLTADYVYPAVLGNAVDFGDLTDARTAPSAMCGSHGGL